MESYDLEWQFIMPVSFGFGIENTEAGDLAHHATKPNWLPINLRRRYSEMRCSGAYQLRTGVYIKRQNAQLAGYRRSGLYVANGGSAADRNPIGQ